MGRRGMRGRPGFLFLIVFIVCLVIFYLSWRTMMTSDIRVKDPYSVQRLSLNEKWRSNSKSGNSVDYGQSLESETEVVAVKQKESAKFVPGFDIQPYKTVAARSKPENFKPAVKSGKQEDAETVYRQPNPSIVEIVNSMERFVHLDLKGAPPKLVYLRSFIPMVKSLGATGLLIEYEDMFPYTGRLKHIRSSVAYSHIEIQEILNLAKQSNLKVMPLIQTFGHMEFVLKSEFRLLRESQYTPQVIDVTNNMSYALISDMVRQILRAHENITHLHIGCDEVYELGRGASAVEMQKKRLTESQMFVNHVQRVANIVKSRSRNRVIPVIWDDELRKIPETDIEISNLPSLVEIMVWHYTANVPQAIDKEVWSRYGHLFTSVWIASAFKGATGARQIFTEPQYHVQNQLSWLDVMSDNLSLLRFKGIALTGWQRYDHFATLCELLPVAIPSLSMCLATVINGGFTKEIHKAASKLIHCDGPVKITLAERSVRQSKKNDSEDCKFPGHELYNAVQKLHRYNEMQASSTNIIDGWLSDYQVAHAFSSPGQLMTLSRSLSKQLSEYTVMPISLRRHMEMIYFEDTVEEWIDENILEKQRHIQKQHDKVQSLLLYTTWPQRPLLSESVNNTEARKSAEISRENIYNYFGIISTTKMPHMENKYQQADTKVIEMQSSQINENSKLSPNSQEKQTEQQGNQFRGEFTLKSQPINESSEYEKLQDDKFFRDKFPENKFEHPNIRNSQSEKEDANGRIVYGKIGSFNGINNEKVLDTLIEEKKDLFVKRVGTGVSYQLPRRIPVDRISVKDDSGKPIGGQHALDMKANERKPTDISQYDSKFKGPLSGAQNVDSRYGDARKTNNSDQGILYGDAKKRENDIFTPKSANSKPELSKTSSDASNSRDGVGLRRKLLLLQDVVKYNEFQANNKDERKRIQGYT